MTISSITPNHIVIAALTSDLDQALQPLMGLAGITSGDIAAVMFSGFDWPAADLAERLDQIHAWLAAEEAFEPEEMS